MTTAAPTAAQLRTIETEMHAGSPSAAAYLDAFGSWLAPSTAERLIRKHTLDPADVLPQVATRPATGAVHTAHLFTVLGY
jgi:hypothetical protein